jgi:hypothetical protein
MKAELTRPVDVKKNKPGDKVTARTTEDVKSDGQVVIPRGSQLVGHVTQAQARAKGESESSLGIVFDHAILRKSGQEVPVHAVIQALASSQTQATAAMDDMDTMASGSGMAMGQASARGSAPRSTGAPASGGGGLVGGAASTVNSTAGVATSTVDHVGGGAAGGTVNGTVNSAVGATGSAAGLNSAGQLTSTSSGVVGLKGLNLSSDASHSTQGSLITSVDRNVHLESGTQILLRVVSE